MARGNKFKPQPAPQSHQEPTAAVGALAQVETPALAVTHASQPATAAQQNGAHDATVPQDGMHHGKRKKKNKSQRRRAAAEQQPNGATPAPLTSHTTRQDHQQQQQQQHQQQQQQQGRGMPDDGSQQPPRKKRKLSKGGSTSLIEECTPGAKVVAAGARAVPAVGKASALATLTTLVVPAPPKSATAAGV